jgi:2-haloacid dehalogenase
MKDTSKKLTLVFDLGAVLIDWDPRHLYRKLFSGDDEAMEYFLAHICSPAWNHQLDLGYSFAQAVAELVEEHPEYAELIYAYHARWEEMAPNAMDGTVELLEALHRNEYPLTALSNWSHETFPFMKRRFAFLEWFDPIVISGKAKLAKPDPQMFAFFLDQIDQKAGDCLFIDDSEPNIVAAQHLGFRTIHFRSAEALVDELERFGLLNT